MSMTNDHDGENLVVETSIQIGRWLSSYRQVALLSFLLSLPASFLTGCDSCEQRVEDATDAVKTFFVYLFWIIVIGIVISILIAIIVAIVKWKREKNRKEAEADTERRKQAARDAEAAELAASKKAWDKYRKTYTDALCEALFPFYLEWFKKLKPKDRFKTIPEFFSHIEKDDRFLSYAPHESYSRFVKDKSRWNDTRQYYYFSFGSGKARGVDLKDVSTLSREAKVDFSCLQSDILETFYNRVIALASKDYIEYIRLPEPRPPLRDGLIGKARIEQLRNLLGSDRVDEIDWKEEHSGVLQPTEVTEPLPDDPCRARYPSNSDEWRELLDGAQSALAAAKNAVDSPRRSPPAVYEQGIESITYALEALRHLHSYIGHEGESSDSEQRLDEIELSYKKQLERQYHEAQSIKQTLAGLATHASSIECGLDGGIGISSSYTVSIEMGSNEFHRPHFFLFGGHTNNHHAIIGGQSGSGKSKFIEVLIKEAAKKYEPDQLQFMLIDCKAVSFKRFQGSKMLYGPIEHPADPESRLEVLEKIENEMERRRRIIGEEGVDDLSRFEGLPRLMVIIDEFTLLFQKQKGSGRNHIDNLLKDILKEGRAFGIHLIFCTQTLGDDLARSVLDNVPIRVAFCMTERQSLIFLDNTDAMNLPTGVAIYNDNNGQEESNVRVSITRISET